jgi:acyl phosphate:glycerol-3-phosphate acyltransferase
MASPLFLLLLACGAFFIGSFPTAYLMVRGSSGQDLRKEGSGNIGALNAYEVSRKRWLGLAVLAVDVLKGALPIALLRLLHGDDFMASGVVLIGLVLGHNYSPWTGFKGGRGLATAAGGALLINPLLVLLWGIAWCIVFFAFRNIHAGNIAASVAAPAGMALLPGSARGLAIVSHPSNGALVLLACAVCALVLIRHIGPIRDMLAARASAH